MHYVEHMKIVEQMKILTYLKVQKNFFAFLQEIVSVSFFERIRNLKAF